VRRPLPLTAPVAAAERPSHIGCPLCVCPLHLLFNVGGALRAAILVPPTLGSEIKG
jgi:hypothetical protein